MKHSFRDSKGKFAKAPKYLMMIIREDALGVPNRNGDTFSSVKQTISNADFVVAMKGDGSDGKIRGTVIKNRWADNGAGIFVNLKGSVG